MNPWEIIVHAIRNMFARKPKPHRQVDGEMGPHTRVAAAHYVARPGMPEAPGLHWEVHYVGGGAFAVELHETWAPGGRTRIRQKFAPMSDLRPETIVAMARTITLTNGGKP